MGNKTKNRILEEALVSFSDNGYKGTNLRDIASKVGITKSALYRYFDSKEEIFNAVLDMIAEYHSEHFGSPDKIPKAPRSCDELYSMTFEKLDFTIHDPKAKLTRRLLYAEQFHNEKARHFATIRFLMGTKEIYKNIFEQMMNNGIIKKDDPEVLAFCYTAPITAMVHFCDREPQKEQEIMEQIEKLVKHFIDEYGIK